MVSALFTIPAFALLGTGEAGWITLAIVVALGVLYPIMYGPEAAFFAELFPANVRYTGISFVYQFSGVFASGLTPLILVYLLDVGPGRTLVIAYFLVVGAITAVCTLAVRRSDLDAIQEAEVR